jgi:hypothetical protein
MSPVVLGAGVVAAPAPVEKRDMLSELGNYVDLGRASR